MKKITNKKSLPAGRQGFSLMEVMISIGIIVTVIVGLMALTTFSVTTMRVNKSKLVAVNLAQEGLEIFRNIRDNNWLNYKRSADNWLDGLSPGDYLVQYNSAALIPFESAPLKISDGIYQYDSGANSPFYRKITIENVDEHQVKVTCQITWQEDGKNNVVSAETRFFNWLEEPPEE